MAEVANLSQAPVAEHSPISPGDSGTDIPKDVKNEENISVSGGLGTSPIQEKSSNSHHHDSEYDTASDLEGEAHDEYEDDDDDDDDDGDEEDEDDDGDEEDEEDEDHILNDRFGDPGIKGVDGAEFEGERPSGDDQEQTDYTKKVDEDRSNPQYIPKKGTFYEHDDRTADEPEGTQSQTAVASEVGENKATSPTTISQASKTMKKWQPALGVDRWSHDRFDANEQAPKSRAELVSAYGYDIRNEDGPPRAHRRRRYARGPSKYSRNWEDETAYIKASNAQRKPPRPEDFPALEERQRIRKSRNYREEKENRFDRQPSDRTRNSGGQYAPNRDNKEPRRSTANPKQYRTTGRQQAMEFKNKNRSIMNSTSSHGNLGRTVNNVEKDVTITKTIVTQPIESNVEQTNFPKINKVVNVQQTVKPVNQPSYNGYELGQQTQSINTNASGYTTRESGDKFVNNHNTHSRQPINTTSSHLSARLQQAQNRNDPSHVGSIQMHTLANQHTSQVPNQNNLQSNMLDLQQQQANQQEHSRTKRYSSLRQRSQHDTPVVPSSPQLDQHTLQQLHIQHEAQQQQQQQQQQQITSNVHPSQQILLQEQHLIQANLMQLYHQENLQAQMQALQVSSLPQNTGAQQTASGKQPYSAMQQPYAPGTAGPPTAFYGGAAPDFNSQPTAAGPPQNQYTQPTAFLQPQPSSAPIAYNATATQPLSQGTMAPPIVASATAQVPPGAVNFVQAAPQNASAAATTAYQNYGNFQNFNTVGGTTYFVPTPQPATRPVVLTQRRPTNAIPILPPSEKAKRAQDSKDEESKLTAAPSSGTPSAAASSSAANAPIGSAENIDHILDNMFVQRPPYQPQTRKSSSPPNEDANKLATSGTGSASIQSDLSSANKSRTHDLSSNITLSDTEPIMSKQTTPSETNSTNIAVVSSAGNMTSEGNTVPTEVSSPSDCIGK